MKWKKSHYMRKDRTMCQYRDEHFVHKMTLVIVIQKVREMKIVNKTSLATFLTKKG